MKKLLLPVIALLASGTYAQTYFEEDFSGGFGAWTLVDSDGDAFEWAIADFGAGDGHGNVASSESWNPDAGAITPNNWMIAGPIDLTAATGAIFIEWDVKAQDPDWVDEEYSVYGATGGGAIAEFLASPYSFNEIVGGTGGEYVAGSLDLSGLAGESDVYIAFRHHNTTDQFRLNMDNIVVRTVSEFDIEMVSSSTDMTVEAGMITISGTVKNNGGASITSFDIDWNDGTSHNETFTETIAPGESYSFTHGTQLSATGGDTYAIDLCASVVEDGDETNNCIAIGVSCVTEVPTKYVVGLEKTGTWCGWCPRGAVALENMEDESLFIGIAVHNGDPMTVASYDGSIGTYVPGGYPGGGVDHVYVGDPSVFSDMFAARSSFIAPASISVSYAEVGENIEVTVKADFVASVSGDYRLAAVVVENHVTGTGSGYNQVNYYSGGGAGAMGGYEDLADPVPAADMVYDHVARALGNDEILGTAGSLPASIDAGDSESYTYTFPKGAEWDLDKLHYVGMIIDASTGEILNAGQTNANVVGINEIESEFNVSVYPNPSSTVAFVEVNLVETSNVSVDVYNAVGELVYTNSTQDLTNGAHIYSIDVDGFSAGLYTVRTTVNNTTQTTKLSVR